LPPPGLGEHAEGVLREAGYTDDQIKQLRERKAI
jgi:crotonobetainyl-CoA:carnitine CoA-transferase CaiB-like acyl-CoA transferase